MQWHHLALNHGAVFGALLWDLIVNRVWLNVKVMLRLYVDQVLILQKILDQLKLHCYNNLYKMAVAIIVGRMTSLLPHYIQVLLITALVKILPWHYVQVVGRCFSSEPFLVVYHSFYTVFYQHPVCVWCRYHSVEHLADKRHTGEPSRHQQCVVNVRPKRDTELRWKIRRQSARLHAHPSEDCGNGWRAVFADFKVERMKDARELNWPVASLVICWPFVANVAAASGTVWNPYDKVQLRLLLGKKIKKKNNHHNHCYHRIMTFSKIVCMNSSYFLQVFK